MSGYLKLLTATARVHSLATGCPFPYTAAVTPMAAFSMCVTSSNGNAGTVFIRFGTTALCGITSVGAARGGTIKATTMIPLLHGQSVTFTGLGRGSMTPRKILFGTGYSYIYGSATSQRVVCSYLTEV